MACLSLASSWALAGAGLGVWVFRSWWAQPAPPLFNPVTDPVIPPFQESLLYALIVAVFMASLLGGLWVAVTVSGIGYLRSARLTGRWWIAWACAVSAAAAASLVFLAVYWDPVPLFGQMVLGHPSWGLLAFSAAFLLAGVAMAAVIIAAAREARRQQRQRPRQVRLRPVMVQAKADARPGPASRVRLPVLTCANMGRRAS